jgi:hypothetical protein
MDPTMIGETEIAAAQVLTGAALLAFLLAGRLGFGRAARVGVVVAYVVGAVGLVVWVGLK